MVLKLPLAHCSPDQSSLRIWSHLITYKIRAINFYKLQRLLKFDFSDIGRATSEFLELFLKSLCSMSFFLNLSASIYVMHNYFIKKREFFGFAFTNTFSS